MQEFSQNWDLNLWLQEKRTARHEKLNCEMYCEIYLKKIKFWDINWQLWGKTSELQGIKTLEFRDIKPHLWEKRKNCEIKKNNNCKYVLEIEKKI